MYIYVHLLFIVCTWTSLALFLNDMGLPFDF